MKITRLFGAALLGISVVSATSVAAQTRAIARAKVPFAFQLGDKSYAAGEYTMRLDSRSFLRLQGQHGGDGILLILADEDSRQTGNAHLTFLRQAGIYQLRDVWVPDVNLHVQCPTAKRVRRQELVQNAEPDGLVEVAVQSGSF